MSGAYSTYSIHKEAVVEDHVITCLVAKQGYEEREPDAYDKALAMDRELVLRFIQASQHEAWERLEEHYAGSAEAEFFKRLEQDQQFLPAGILLSL